MDVDVWAVVGACVGCCAERVWVEAEWVEGSGCFGAFE